MNKFIERAESHINASMQTNSTEGAWLYIARGFVCTLLAFAQELHEESQKDTTQEIRLSDASIRKFTRRLNEIITKSLSHE